jgi:hypothetical protein
MSTPRVSSLFLSLEVAMADKSAWLIAVGEGVDPVAQIAAAELRKYGVQVKGQHWPLKEKQAWLASADEAAQANAGLIILVTTPELYGAADIKKSLSFFRLYLQTKLGRHIEGFVHLVGQVDTAASQTFPSGQHVLGDWWIPGAEKWVAKAVARLHAPSKSSLPIVFRAYAQERLGVWLEVRPNIGQAIQGCFLGVTGEGAKITFHAVGESSRLPDRTINEFESKGIKFEFAGAEFEAWGLQNNLNPNDSYFVRLEGEPTAIAVGAMPGGEITEVDLVRLA